VADEVTLTHPDLPGQEITVLASQVPVHEKRGWAKSKSKPTTTTPDQGTKKES